MKIISTTEQLHINKCYIASNVLPRYFVEWETTTIYKNWLGHLKTKSKSVYDRLAFLNLEDAQQYGEGVERPSKQIWTWDNYKNYWTEAYIFPKGWQALYNNLKKYLDNDNVQKFIRLIRLNTIGIDINLSVNGITIKNPIDYKSILDSPEVQSQVNNLLNDSGKCFERVKTVDISPVGAYQSTVTGESIKSRQSRQEIIDAELLRIEEYKKFLSSFK